jgi:hypothetical protein
MLRTFARRAAAAAVPLITLPVLALAAAPGTAQASAPAATIQFHDQAQLQTDGSIIVTLDYSCNPAVYGTTGELQAEAQQPGVDGFGFTITATCNDQKHTMTLDLMPGPFMRGTASATATISSAGNNTAQTQAELKVS